MLPPTLVVKIIFICFFICFNDFLLITDDSVVFESETVTETCTETSTRSVEGAVQQRWSHENRIVSSSVVLLYIQMQLCSQTLRQWLNERNATLKNIAWSTKGIDLELSIFRQIVKGINYVHNSNIIHRDIKVNFNKFE